MLPAVLLVGIQWILLLTGLPSAYGVGGRFAIADVLPVAGLAAATHLMAKARGWSPLAKAWIQVLVPSSVFLVVLVLSFATTPLAAAIVRHGYQTDAYRLSLAITTALSFLPLIYFGIKFINSDDW